MTKRLAEALSAIRHLRGPRALYQHDGHADLSTTMRYMHLSPASLNQAIRLLEQPVAADSSLSANSRGETGETAPASERNRKNHS